MITAKLGKNKEKKRGVFIATDKISELDFFMELVKEINDQRRLHRQPKETLKFFQEVSSLVAEGFVEEDPEYATWAVESAASAFRIAVEA